MIIGKYILIPLIAVLLMLASSAVAIDESDDTDPDSIIISPDSIEDSVLFIEIHSTPEGTYGVDSSGIEWEFDFSSDKYIKIDVEVDHKTTKTTFGRKHKKIAISTPVTISVDELLDLPEIPDFTTYTRTKKIKGLKLGDVVVDEDEKIKGSIIALGAITVHGLVTGDVTSYDKITVTSTGKIMGDAHAPEIEKMRGGEILGKRQETNLPRLPNIEIVRESSFTALQANIIIMLALLLAGLLSSAIIKQPTERVKVCLQKSFVKSFFVGLLIWILVGPLCGLLVLTVVGIPVAIFGLPIFTLLGVLMGSVALGQLTGEIIMRYRGKTKRSQLWNIIFGLSILYSFWIIMSLFGASSAGVNQGLSTLFLVLAIIIWSIGGTAGIGAALLTRLGSRDCAASEIETKTSDILGPAPLPPTPPPLK